MHVDESKNIPLSDFSEITVSTPGTQIIFTCHVTSFANRDPPTAVVVVTVPSGC